MRTPVATIIPEFFPASWRARDQGRFRLRFFRQDGKGVDSDGVSVADFNTTIATALGIDTEKEHFSPSKRPFRVGGWRQAVAAVLAIGCCLS